MADNAEKAQHLRRCPTHTIPQPRVACTIAWQPWAIKSATPTALKHIFCNAIPSFHVVKSNKSSHEITQTILPLIINTINTPK